MEGPVIRLEHIIPSTNLLEWITHNITRENIHNITFYDSHPICHVETFRGCIPHFLKMGANPNVADIFGETPLILVCLSDYYDSELVRMLLDYGASVNTVDGDGHSALYATLVEFYSNCYIDIHIPYGTRNNLCKIHMEKIMLLLDRGAVIDDKWETETLACKGRMESEFKVAPRVKQFIASRNACRFACIIVCGIGKEHRLKDKNISKLVAKHLWSMRMT